MKTRLAVYDTGFGLHVCPELYDDESREVSTMSVSLTSLFKIQLPDENLPFDEWIERFQIQKRIILMLVKSYNDSLIGGDKK